MRRWAWSPSAFDFERRRDEGGHKAFGLIQCFGKKRNEFWTMGCHLLGTQFRMDRYLGWLQSSHANELAQRRRSGGSGRVGHAVSTSNELFRGSYVYSQWNDTRFVGAVRPAAVSASADDAVPPVASTS